MEGTDKKARENYLTLKELCAWLKVPKATIYDYTFRKRIPFVRVGKLLRFPESWIESWLIDPEQTLRRFFDKQESSITAFPVRLRSCKERR